MRSAVKSSPHGTESWETEAVVYSPLAAAALVAAALAKVAAAREVAAREVAAREVVSVSAPAALAALTRGVRSTAAAD
jgi:heme A synthase